MGLSDPRRYFPVRFCARAACGSLLRGLGLVCALLLAGFHCGAAFAQPVQVGIELKGGSDPYAPAVARIVRSFVEYSQWPGNQRAITLCVIGFASHAENLGEHVLSDGRRLDVVRAGTEFSAYSSCNALYLGRMPLADLRRINDRAAGAAIMTIAEDDVRCRSHAMFCLVYNPRLLSFRMNIDAISRSGLRVDPRVLRLATGEEGG